MVSDLAVTVALLGGQVNKRRESRVAAPKGQCPEWPASG